MQNKPQDQELACIARRRAAMKVGFLIHLVVFIAVNTLLFVLHRQGAPAHAWFHFPLGGWALGLCLHGLAVYLSGSGLRERLVESELRKLQSRPIQGLR